MRGDTNDGCARPHSTSDLEVILVSLTNTVSALRRNPVRLYLYSVTVAILLMLVTFGVIESEAMFAVLGVASAVLAVPAVEVARSKVTPVAKEKKDG